MIVDGEHRISKKKLNKYLSDLKLKPIPDVAYDKQIKSLAKGGLMMTIKTECKTNHPLIFFVLLASLLFSRLARRSSQTGFGSSAI